MKHGSFARPEPPTVLPLSPVLIKEPIHFIFCLINFYRVSYLVERKDSARGGPIVLSSFNALNKSLLLFLFFLSFLKQLYCNIIYIPLNSPTVSM